MRFRVPARSLLALTPWLVFACSGTPTPGPVASDSTGGVDAGSGASTPPATSPTGTTGAAPPAGTNPPAGTTSPGGTAPVTAGSDAAATAPAGPDAAVSPPPPGPSQGSDASAKKSPSGPEAGSPPAPDATSSPVPLLDASIAIDASTPPTSAFTCTLLIGIQATEEWYIAGFETMVDNTRWELMWYHSGFVELWANPNDPVWATSITSPCAANADKPDRVIFVTLNYLNDTLAFWSPNVNAVVANIQAKYPSAKRIELATFIRAPGNMACPQAPAPRSTITPAQDQSMAMAAAANPGLVFVAPPFEVASCDQYSSNPPHPTAAGATAWATMMANYYR